MLNLPASSLSLMAKACALAALAWAMPLSQAVPAAPTTVAASSGRVIVKLRANSSTLRAQTLAVRPERGLQRAAVLGRSLGLNLVDGRALDARTQVLAAEGLSAAELVKRLAAHPDVEWVVEDQRRKPHFVPNDPLYPLNSSSTLWQWTLHAPGNANSSAINAEAAWDKTTGSPSVVVAVIDSGARPDHPDLQGKLIAGYDFVGWGAPNDSRSVAEAIASANDGDQADADASDPGDWITAAEAGTATFQGCEVGNSSWHGTQVAGLIGAAGHNSIGMVGLGGQTMVMPVRVLGKCGGFDSDIIAGMRWAAGLTVAGVPTTTTPAKILNLSLGSEGACSAAYASALTELKAAGVVVVASAGNAGKAVESPANCDGVIAVGAVTHLGAKTDYASLGPQVSLSAPGGNCVSNGSSCVYTYAMLTTTDTGQTTPGSGRYTDGADALEGTSFSAPLVTGTIALMRALQPTLTPDQILSKLKSSVRAFPTNGAGFGLATCQAPGSTAQATCYCTTSTCGAGMLDAAAAVGAVLGPTASFSVSPSAPQVGQTITLDSAGSKAADGRTLTAWSWRITAGASVASISGSASAATLSLNALAAGDVTVALDVTDDAGSVGSTSRSITVASNGGGGGGGGIERRGGGAWPAVWLGVLLGLGLGLGRRRRLR